MRLQLSLSVYLGIFAIAASLTDASSEAPSRHVVGRDSVEQLVFEILLNSRKTEQVVKRDGPISVIATDKCGDHGALIEEAVGDINQAFGYGKLALRWRDDIRTPEDDQIVFLLGSVSDGRLLIERAGVSSPGSFGPGSFRYWYESYTNQSLTKGLVAIDDSLPIEEIRFLARKYLLSVLGFRGTSRDLRKHESFFSSDYIAKRCQGGEGLPNPRMLTEADSAMLRFSDRWVAASMNWDEIRNVFDRKWSQTQEGFLTPVLDEHTAHEPDKTQLSFKNVQHHSQQAEPLGGSAQGTEPEAVLACDLVVLMGKEKDKMASFRLRKGTRARIVEEQARRSLLFFGSDRLIYVPNEAIDSRGGAPSNEIEVELLKPRDNTERIAANGMLEKRFMLNVNQMQIFRGSEGKKVQPFEAFSSAGVHFPEGSAAILTSPSELMVRTTPTAMALVDAIMKSARSSY